MQVFHVWMDTQSKPFGWNTVIEVLGECLDQKVLASELEEQYMP